PARAAIGFASAPGPSPVGGSCPSWTADPDGRGQRTQGHTLRSFPKRRLGLARLARPSPVRSVTRMTSTIETPFRVLIAGGGVAALEAALALRDLAGDRIAMTMLSPQPEYVYRPMRVREPFAYAGARQYPLTDIARDIGVELRQDAFKSL